MPLTKRLRSLAGWADAASFTMADITMLRREMLIGFGVAGFLAALVPTQVWSVVFISHHGLLTAVENAVIGPLIAIISFVCSIGNVPLAAALWKGGISFGGVVSFVFADLITLPLLLIYRKFYGGRLTLWILASFWLVMSVTGLVIGEIFSLLHLVPMIRPVRIVPESFAWNYTAILDLIFLAVLGTLYYLHRNRSRFGGGLGYAIDPVCGMQVETATAPARAEYQGNVFWFCSDRCETKFVEAPARYADGKTGDRAATASGPSGYVIRKHDGSGHVVADVVCGMNVDPSTAADHRTLEGTDYHFCSSGCAETFDRDPSQFAGVKLERR
jgi:YHS domain-containing protein